MTEFIIKINGGKVVIDYPENLVATEKTLYSGAARKICEEMCNVAEMTDGDINEIHEEFLKLCMNEFPYYKYSYQRCIFWTPSANSTKKATMQKKFGDTAEMVNKCEFVLRNYPEKFTPKTPPNVFKIWHFDNTVEYRICDSSVVIKKQAVNRQMS